MFPCLHRSDGFPEMARLHAARSCATSLLSRSLLISSITHSFQVFLPLPRPLSLQPEFPYMPTPSCLHSNAPHVQTISICFFSQPPQCFQYPTSPRAPHYVSSL